MVKRILKRIPKPLGCLLGAAVLLLCCLLVGQLMLPHQIYLPAGTLNDEVVYNRQVAGVLQGGMPQGVFGYDESRADIGHFGAWGPVIIYLYALPGLLSGGGVNLMLWGNVFFALAGWLAFVMTTRIAPRRQALFGCALLMMATPVACIFSGTVETFHHALVLVLTGLACAALRKPRPALYLAMFALCAVGSLVRPYELTLWLYPLVVSLRHKSRRGAVLCVAGGLVSLPAGLFCLLRLSAPYFVGGMNFAPLQALTYGDASVLLDTLRENSAEIFHLMVTGRATNCWLLLVLLVLTLAAFCYDAPHHRPAPLKGCALVVSVVVALALLLLYQPLQTNRHLLMPCMALLAALLLENWNWLLYTLPVLATVFALSGCRQTFFTVPQYDAALDAELQVLHQALEESQDARPAEDAWDATLAYSTYDNTFHGYLYAVPAGMGIEFDRCELLADPEEPISSRYVMTTADSNCVPRLAADGWLLLVETDHCVVYERGDG